MRHTGTIESQRLAGRGEKHRGREIKLIAPRSGRKCEMAVLG